MKLVVRQPKVLVPAAIILLAGFVFAMGDHPVSTGPAEGTTFVGAAATQPASSYLRIGTFNIDGGQGLDDKVDLERTASCMQKLDFIGMNEVHGFVFASPQNQAIVLGDLLHLPSSICASRKALGP